uniref:Putative secreted protein n=1 Tax=Anopheles darlingi TaxID=43151 RepID=A0A2M4D6R1_ANODA
MKLRTQLVTAVAASIGTASIRTSDPAQKWYDQVQRVSERVSELATDPCASIGQVARLRHRWRASQRVCRPR